MSRFFKREENKPYTYSSIEMRASSKGYFLPILFITLIVGLLFLIFRGSNTPLTPSPTPSSSPTQQAVSPSPTGVSGVLSLGKRTKTSGCVAVNGLPDKECTPGDTDPRVTQDNINQTICVSGYTKTVRPPVSYTSKLKIVLMSEYGDTDSPANYELDHLISLELGGNPTSEANLWPESYIATPTAREKDRVENYLHDQICSGKISLKDAQFKVANNWEEVYSQMSPK